MPKIGAKMIDERLKADVLQLRILMGMVGKFSKQSIEQKLAAMNVDLSGLQFGILHVLEDEACTISELSRTFSLDPSTFVPSIDALERKGFVSRGRDPDDRRRVPLSLTEEGGAIMQRVRLNNDDDPLAESLQKMGHDAAQQLVTLLREFVFNLPEGDEMLKSVEARLQHYQAKSEDTTIEQK